MSSERFSFSAGVSSVAGSTFGLGTTGVYRKAAQVPNGGGDDCAGRCSVRYRPGRAPPPPSRCGTIPNARRLFRDSAGVARGFRTIPRVTAGSPLDPELARWIDVFRGPLIGLCASWGADWARAEELAMDTFAEAWMSRERFRPGAASVDSLGPWLRGIAFHLWMAARRRDRRWPAPLPVAEPAAPAPIADERQDLLRRAFAELEPELQQILHMHYLETTTARSMAALLGVTKKAVERRLERARAALREVATRLERNVEARR